VKYFVKVNGHDHEVVLTERLGELQVEVDGEVMDLVYEEVDSLGQVLAIMGDESSFGVSIEGDSHRAGITIAGHFYDIEIEDERERAALAAARAAGAGGGLVKSVMPGVVVSLLVAEGDVVEEGQPLLVLEAMKMQNEIAAPAAGSVRLIHVQEGEAVSAGAKLVDLEVASES
jgi:biotin carboxyl carrier protein